MTPLKLHFYIVKLGFTGVYIIFHISAQNIDYGYSLEPPRLGGSNKYPQSMFCAEIWKVSWVFLSENFQFLEMKSSIYLNRRVFVMLSLFTKRKEEIQNASFGQLGLIRDPRITFRIDSMITKDQKISLQKHTYIILTPVNPTFI